MADTGAPLYLEYLEPDQGEADIIFNGNMDLLNLASGGVFTDVTVGGNLGVGTSTFGTSANHVIAMASGTAPTTSPADAIQMWEADRGGVAGKGALHLRAEDGTSHVFGDQVGIGTLSPTAQFHVTSELAGVTNMQLEYYQSDNGGGTFVFRKARGTPAAPANLAGTEYLGSLIYGGYHTSGFQLSMFLDTRCDGTPAATYIPGRMVISGYDGSGTFRTHLAIRASSNIGIGTETFGTSAVRVLALASGTAPTTSPADAIQLWSADRAGTALKASLHLRTEDGTSHVLGDLVGLGTLLTATLGVGSYQALNVRGSTLYVGQSSVQERAQALLAPSWVVSTDATRTARLTLSAYDATAAREALRLEASGTAAMVGFYGGAAVAKPTVTGSRGGNAALASLLSALASMGLVTDSSTA